MSEGVHVASCIWIIDLGEQYSEKFGTTQHKVMLTWETPDETIEVDGEARPRVISKEYTLSLSEKATLRAHLEAWRGRAFTDEQLAGFDLRNVLGCACQLQIVHTNKNGTTRANIKSIMSLPKGMGVPKPSSEMIYFALDDPACLPLMDRLPKWIQDKIAASPTYQALVCAQSDPESGDYAPMDSGDSEDLPF